MSEQIDWKNECDKIANILADEICRKFAANEKIVLDMCRPINAGAVYGLLEKKYLNDELNTVIITYCVIDRKDIVPDRAALYQAAADRMDEILKHPDWQVIKDTDEFRTFLREKAEWAAGHELQYIFSEAACADPDKYPKYKTHGHAVKKRTLEDLEKEKIIPAECLKNFWSETNRSSEEK